MTDWVDLAVADSDLFFNWPGHTRIDNTHVSLWRRAAEFLRSPTARLLSQPRTDEWLVYDYESRL